MKYSIVRLSHNQTFIYWLVLTRDFYFKEIIVSAFHCRFPELCSCPYIDALERNVHVEFKFLISNYYFVGKLLT